MKGDRYDELDGYKRRLKPYTAAQLQVMYGISQRTWYNWYGKLKAALGPKDGWTFDVRQVRIIFERKGPPPFDEFGNEVVD